ncbi:MAG TPA: DNA polymerase III subunit beta [Candidatus Paceibacterota bacterium]|nr:DNA polymerase III subunit beta [Candidatus Paceibacterota bacterium]
MKISVSQENLKRALSLTERATSRTSTLPILNNVLLRTENGRLRVSATNLEVGVHCVIGAKVEREGSVAVPAKTFSDFVSSSPAGALTLAVQNNILALKSPSYQTSVLGFDTAEYPIIPRISGGEMGGVDSGELRALLLSVVDAAAVQENRPELSGILLRFSSDAVTAAATDSYRLAERRIVFKGKRTESVIVPRMTVMEVIRMCDQVSGDVIIRIGDNQVSFTGEDTEVVSRLIDGRYPDYQKIIPEKAASRTLVPRQELESAVRLASVFSSNLSDIVVSCSEKGLRIAAKNSAKGDATVLASATLKGEPYEVSLNYRYLGDGLKAVPGSDVVLEYTGAGSPFVIRMAEEPKDTLYLVMPLKT